MTLEEAYSVGKKYGFTFNGIGPSFSFINNKVGICLNLLDQKYGYLKRNFTFDNINDLDNFLKKYRFYIRNKDNENIYLSLDDYEIENPTIYYSFDVVRENKRKIDLQNKSLLLDDIKSFLNKYFAKLDQLIDEIKQRYVREQDYYYKLNYYKKILYQVYNKPYEENVIKVDEILKNKIVNNLLEFKKKEKLKIDGLDIEAITLKDIEIQYKELILKCQEILLDEKIIKILYEKKQYDCNIETLERMVDYLLYNQELTDNTQKDLQQIKESSPVIETYVDFKKLYEQNAREPFDKLDINNVLSYNPILFGATPINYNVYSEQQIEEIDIAKIRSSYDDLNEESKRAITLLYSPLKPILNYIIEQAYKKNNSFNFETKAFKTIYNKMVACLNKSENFVFKLKYFKDIKFDNYSLFIKSLVKVAKIICSSYLKLPFDLMVYSLNFYDCLITGSDKVIQSGDDIVRIINAKVNTFIIYSPTKITINSSNNLFELKDNRNVIYFPSFSNKCVDSNSITNVSIFEEGYNVMNVSGDNLLIVTNFVLQNKISYTDTIMTGRIKEDK